MKIKLSLKNNYCQQLQLYLHLYEKELISKGNENVKIESEQISFRNKFITYQSRMNVFSSIKEGTIQVENLSVNFYYKSRKLPLYFFIIIIIFFFIFKTTILLMLSVAFFLMYLSMNFRTYFLARLWLKQITSKILKEVDN